MNRWPYKFVHALLRIVSQKGNLNIQAETPVMEVSERDVDGWITVNTPRGDIRAKAVVHATNRWASHLLPDFSNLIFGNRGSLANIKAPRGFIKNTGAQHWDHLVNVSLHSRLGPADWMAKYYRITTSNFLHHTTTSSLAGADPFLYTTRIASSLMTVKISNLTGYQSSSGLGLPRMLLNGQARDSQG